MSILCLNCWDLGKPHAADNIRRLFIRRYESQLDLSLRAQVVLYGDAMSSGSLPDYDDVFADCRGRSGGLAMVWTKTTSAKLLSCAANHIDIAVKWSTEAEEWRFTGLSGFPEKENKLKARDLLLGLRLHSALPWLVGGDFNERLFNYEKKGGQTKPQAT